MSRDCSCGNLRSRSGLLTGSTPCSRHRHDRDGDAGHDPYITLARRHLSRRRGGRAEISVMRTTGDATTFPTNRAFVVQFAAGVHVPGGALFGRVEHVLSAHAAHFHSLDELLEFIARVLSETATASEPASSEKGGDHPGPGQA